MNPINAFTPSSEITDPEKFSGRTQELDKISLALQTDGAHIVIYGNRGVGKSSLTNQMCLLASGNKKVLKLLPSKPYIEFNYKVIQFKCDDSVKNIELLLARLLASQNHLQPYISLKRSEEKNELGVAAGFKGFFNAQGKTTTTHVANGPSPDTVSHFNNAINTLLNSGTYDAVLIAIDEFDRIAEKSGIASLIKSSPRNVKFSLTGVSSNVKDLLNDHGSLDRAIADGSIEVKPMTEQEAYAIIDKAEKAVEHAVEFLSDAREYMHKVSRGHPFYIHLVGKHTLLEALRAKEKNITREMCEKALNLIALNNHAPTQEKTYKDAIGHSYTREAILKEFAMRNEDEIHTTETYQKLSRQLSLESSVISVYVGHLGSDKYGAVLEKTQERY
ncbi:AAA family ATPase [Azotobacter sp. CWF10]